MVAFLGTLVSGLLTMLSLFYHNNTSTAGSLDTFDFSTLYTSIPHVSLKHVMKILLNEAFRVRGARCLSFTKGGKRFWSNDGKSEINITKSMLVGMIEYLVDNIYVSVGSTVFRQCVGIPMGTDCAVRHCWPIYHL